MAVFILSGDQVVGYTNITVSDSTGDSFFEGVTRPFLATDTITITMNDIYLIDTNGDGILDEIDGDNQNLIFESVVVTRDNISYTLNDGGAGLSLEKATEGMGDQFIASDEAAKWTGAPFGDIDTRLIFTTGSFPAGDSFTLLHDTNLDPSDGDDGFFEIPCFCKGTKISTDSGQVFIEDLVVGDLVVTKDHGLQKIRWIGSQTVSGHGKLAPVRFETGIIGNSEPLYLSQQHRVLIEDWRVDLMYAEPAIFSAAKHMVNGTSIRIEPVEEVEYFHILCDNHEVVIANGAPTETLLIGSVARKMLTDEQLEEIDTIFPGLIDNPDASVAAYHSLRRPESVFLCSSVGLPEFAKGSYAHPSFALSKP